MGLGRMGGESSLKNRAEVVYISVRGFGLSSASHQVDVTGIHVSQVMHSGRESTNRSKNMHTLN